MVATQFITGFAKGKTVGSARCGMATLPTVAMLMATVAPALAADLKVVVTTKPIHALVASVMGAVGNPKLIVEGAASPHTFTLKPSGAKAINEADIFIRVSEHVEPFTHKIAESLPSDVTLVTLADAKGMTLLDQREGGAFEKHQHHGSEAHEDHDEYENGHKGAAGHHDDDDHDHAAKDGHIWLDTANAKQIVETIAAALAEKYPDHAADFTANAASTLAKIDVMAAEIETLVGPVKSKPFIVFHDATQYFEKRFGLEAAGSITISPDIQPSAKRLTAVRKRIASLDAACVFSEPGFQPKLVAAVTEGTTARSGSLDAEGVLLSPGPELYFNLMRGLARNIAECLRTSP